MFLLLVFHPIVRRLYDLIRPLEQQSLRRPQRGSHNAPDGQADARLDRRVQFDVGFACVYLLALHGTSAFKVLLILYINFTLAKGLPKAYVPLATWAFNIGILFANELGRGYPYEAIAQLISPWVSAVGASPDTKVGGNWGTLLDRYGGLQPRWEILFNITILRLISFNLDYRWSLDLVGGSPLEVSGSLLSNISRTCRLIA